MADFKVGDKVVVIEGPYGHRPRTPVEGVVVRVGRINMDVEWGHGAVSTFRLSDGMENTPHTRMYSQDAHQVYTPDGWAEKERRDAALKRIKLHQHGRCGVLTDGGLRRITTDNAIRLADLLDEITPEITSTFTAKEN